LHQAGSFQEWLFLLWNSQSALSYDERRELLDTRTRASDA